MPSPGSTSFLVGPVSGLATVELASNGGRTVTLAEGAPVRALDGGMPDSTMAGSYDGGGPSSTGGVVFDGGSP